VTMALVVLVASLAILAYTYVGYPLLLAAWGRLRPREVRRASFEPPVAIVIVTHDGEALLRRKIASCLGQDYPADRLRVLVVSDGSTDATCRIAESAGDARVGLLAFADRRGKAACVNDAIDACGEDFVVMTDVRQPLERHAVRRLLANFADPEVGAVGGALEHRKEGAGTLGEGMDAYWRYEQFIRRAETRVHSMVGVAGALYALRRTCFRPVPGDTILDDVLIPMRVVLQGRRVVFEETALAFDEPLGDLSRERRRKVRTLAGNFQLFARHPALLSPWRNPVFLQLVSHKLMRLACPVALVAALAANLLLAPEGAAFVALLAAQAAGYGAAAIGMVWDGARRFRLVRLAMTFVSLNAFVVLGFVEFASGRDTHLWKVSSAPGEHRHPAS
jgi:biofilm PGA synthesis N-glycosyltransferase PgaC